MRAQTVEEYQIFWDEWGPKIVALFSSRDYPTFALEDLVWQIDQAIQGRKTSDHEWWSDGHSEVLDAWMWRFSLAAQDELRRRGVIR